MKKEEQTNNRCETPMIHEDVVQRVKGHLPEENEVFELANLFKVLGDPSRVRILSVLQVEEICVCDIAHLLNMTHSAISHQLSTLKQARLVKNRREGKMVYYSLDDDHVATIFAQGLDHINE